MGFFDKLKGFGKRVWSGIKGFGGKVIDTGKKVFKKVGEVAGKVVSPVAKVLSFLPGTLGTIGRVVSGVTDAVKTVTDQIPNSEAKKKINDFVTKIDDTSHKVINKIEEGGQKAQGVIGKIEKGIDTAKQIPGTLMSRIKERVGDDIAFVKKISGGKGMPEFVPKTPASIQLVGPGGMLKTKTAAPANNM